MQKLILLLSGWSRQFFAFYKTGPWARVLFFFGLSLPFLPVFYLFVLLPLLHPVKLSQKISSTGDVAPKLANLKTDEMFFQSQLKLARFDSINLAIDLVDSVVFLQIRGVRMRQCKIHSFRVNRMIRQLQRSGTFYSWLSTPFISQTDWSTIPKAPIKVKTAPKDTTEANQKSDTTKVVLERPDTFFTIQYDKGLVVEIGQKQWPTLIGGIKKLFYNVRLKIDEVRNTVSALDHPELPRHPIHIELELQKNDVKAIYRALPKKSGLALRLRG